MVISDKFILNGIEGTSKDISLVTFDNEILINKGIPFSRNINSVDGYSQLNPMFKDEDTPPEDIILNLMYVINGVPQEWTEWKLIDVNNWVITQDFIPFQTFDNLDYVYYLKCKKIQNKMTPNGIGILECTFTPLSHFAYKKIDMNISVTKSFDVIVNNSSLYEYRPIIKIKNLGNESTINKIGDFEIKGLNTNETVTIDNLMLSVINSNNVNRFVNCNRNWIKLVHGDNILKVSGNCEVQILCEFPIIL